MIDMHIHWARLDLFFIVAIGMVGFLLVLWYCLKKTTRVVGILVDPHQIKRLLPGYRYVQKVLKFLLFLTGIMFLGVALLRPQWNEEQTPVFKEGRDVLIALDISRSMLAQDLQPDRLAYAKEKVRQLLAKLKTERVGLMLFSGTTFLQCPLTNDIGAFLMFLDAIDVETISSGTTSIDSAIQAAISVFEKMPERKSKLLIIFTDGEDFSSDLAATKKRAAALGLYIITVGVGTLEGAPIPLYDRLGKQVGHQLDAKGNVVISRLNEGILHRLAEDTGGMFVPMSKDDADIKQVQHFIAMFEKEQLSDRQIRQFQEQYQWPLLISFICLVLEWLL